MKQIVRAMGLCGVLIAVAPVALAQDRPGAVAAEAVESVVTVREVNYDTRMVTVERPDGTLATIQVPPEAHNLYQVKPGAKFKVRYLESVAIDVLDPGTEADTGTVQIVERAPKGGTPGGAIVNVSQVTVKVEEVDYTNRTLVVSGPQGKREFKVGPEVKRLNEVKPGDLIRVRYTEALALQMVQP